MGFNVRICQLCAAFLLTYVACVESGGVVTNMTAIPAEATAGSMITIRCTVFPGTSLTTTVRLRKTFATMTWHLFTNDETDDALDALQDTVEKNRFSVEFPTRSGQDAFTVSYYIQNARNADSGNYSCQVSNTTKYAYVNVLAEATNISMYFGNERITQSNATVMERRYVQLNGKYRLNCTVGGGNPYPEVMLASDSGSIPGPSVANRSYQRGGDFLSTVFRDATVMVPEWTADISYIGKPLRCSGGINNPKALSVGFIPVTNHTEPLFSCNDTVYISKQQTDLVHSCLVYSYPANITTLYIHWHFDNIMLNISASGAAALRPGRMEYKLPSDGHYQLIIDSPTTSTDHWWKMTLKVEGIHTRPNDLNNMNFDFVAMNSFATAKHVVKAYVDMSVGGASRGMNFKFSAAGVLLIAVLCLLTNRRQ